MGPGFAVREPTELKIRFATLRNVRCPVLGVFGEKDPLTDATAASSAMRKVLSEAGHKDFTTRIFPNAGHSLGEQPSGSRMAPGVFDTLRAWLKSRVRVAPQVAGGS
jgi:pimeloyl-ACP methyl ester carboxylesterase